MKFIDSHCHLDFEPLSVDIEGAIERAGRTGVTKIINIGTSLHRSQRSVELANYYPSVWASVGLHPQDVGDIHNLEEAMAELERMARKERVVAIGEIGLDYYSTGDGKKGGISTENKAKQKALLTAQIELAQKLGLPIVFHVRDAWDDFFSIISNFEFQASNSTRAVVHCFTGDAATAKRLVDLGLYIGFTGLTTFKNASTAGIKEAVRVVPIDRVLIETDAPFLAPEPHRGKTNEPSYVVEIARAVAELRGQSVSEIARATTANAEKLFRI